MGRLNRYGAHRQRRIGVNYLRVRISLADNLALIYHLAGAVSGFHSVYRESDILIIRADSFNINRRFRIIDKFEVLSGGLRNSRVGGRIHVSNYHGMIVSLRDLKLRQKHRVIKRCGYLADTASQAVHHLTVQVGSRHIIAVRLRKGRYRLVG